MVNHIYVKFVYRDGLLMVHMIASLVATYHLDFGLLLC